MNDTIGIAGLGLIGGSLAKAIKARTGCRVLGYDIREDVLSGGQQEGVIDGKLTDDSLSECSVVIVALYPEDIISYVKNNLVHMRKGAVVVDCAGVKTRICRELSPLAKDNGIRFVGGHPMAGIEKSGYENSFSGLFEGASMILCEDENTDKTAVDELGLFFKSIGFGKVIVTTAEEHDEIIAYTSQLAHLVSSAFIRSGIMEKHFGFSAGSYKDLTRVAKLDAEMWTELFFENRENLLKVTDELIDHICLYRDALKLDDRETLKALLKSGNELKIKDDETEREWLIENV